MSIRTLAAASLFAASVTAAAPTGLAAQTFFLDGMLNQAYTSDPLPSPMGFAIQAGRTGIWGPLGLQFLYRQVFEDGGEVAQSCGFASCIDGPFNQSYSMRTVGMGLSYDFINPTDVVLTLAMNAGANWQLESLEHIDSGEELTGTEIGSDYSLGGSLDLRLRPWLGPLRPVFSVRYDRIWAGDCAADTSCGSDRNAWAFSAGLGVAVRKR